MKKYIYATLVAGTALFFTACSDEMEQMSIKHAGDEILFGGRAGFEMTGDAANSKTRTVYTGNIWEAENEAGETKTYEGVNWVKDDKVRIFCKNAAGTQVADYTVSATNEEAIKGTEEHEVYLEKIGNVGLQWSNETEYDFYAVYPSPHQYPLNSDGSVNNSVALNGNTTVNGTIPVVQTPLKRTGDNNGNYVFAPHMEYAYMVARQNVKNANKTKKEIYLNFVPIATAVEIELYNGITGYETNLATLKLTNILISAKNENTPIAGDFTADLSKLTDGNGDGSYCGIPESDFVETGTNTFKQITIPMYSDGLYGDPTDLAPGKSIKFTVFMLPTQKVEDLKVTIQGATGSATGSTTGIEIKMHKKTYLKKMPVTNAVMPFDQSKWVEYLPDNAYLKGLSIPGAGGAASGIKGDKDEYGTTATDWNTNQKYLEQKLNIAELWAHGIRCFEFTVDRSTATSNVDLGAQPVFCNTKPSGMTLRQAVSQVKAMLETYPEEFAMVIITYQAANGWETRNSSTAAVTNTNNRNPQLFMEQLNDFWTEVTNGTWTNAKGTKLFGTSLTVNDARGHLFCIARPTSEGEDNYVKVSTNSTWVGTYLTGTDYTATLPDITEVNPYIYVINGWGALKDKWEARGYTKCAFHRGIAENGLLYNSDANDTKRATLGYDANGVGRPFDVASSVNALGSTLTDDYSSSKVSTLNPNFYYGVMQGNTTLQANKAWVQEWARVSKGTGKFTGSNKGIYWPSSLEEKKARIEECLDYALKDSIDGVKVNDVLFINSLCGYYVDISESNSYLPNSLTDMSFGFFGISNNLMYTELSASSNVAGMSGDISSFASEMNTHFYNYLQKKVDGSDFVPGPMGIILMDRVGQDVASTQIPSIIIANNFQYVLPSAPAAAALSMPRSDYDPQKDGDPAAKTRSNKSNGGFTITWE